MLSLTLVPQTGKSIFEGKRRERIDYDALHKLLNNPQLLPKYVPSEKDTYRPEGYTHEAHLLSLWNNVEVDTEGKAWLKTDWEPKCR